MTTPALRAVDANKHRLDLPCGCGFLFEPIGEARWTKTHVRACNQKHPDGIHRMKETTKVTALPEVSA